MTGRWVRLGRLPLDELNKPGTAKVMYLQAEVLVTQPGLVELEVDTTQPATLWLDEDAIEKTGKRSLDLTAGRHVITIRIAMGGSSPAPTVRVQLRKPAGSTAQFELVN